MAKKRIPDNKRKKGRPPVGGKITAGEPSIQDKERLEEVISDLSSEYSGDSEEEQESGMCKNCGKRKGIVKWTGEGGYLALSHGFYEMWCKLCVAEAQLEYAQETVTRIPELETEVERLRGIEDPVGKGEGESFEEQVEKGEVKQWRLDDSEPDEPTDLCVELASGGTRVGLWACTKWDEGPVLLEENETRNLISVLKAFLEQIINNKSKKK